jgi:copper chaperone
MAPTQDIKTYTVAGMSCAHCVTALSEEVEHVAGVEWLEISLEAKRLTVRGRDLDDAAVRAAIGEAGYEAAP